MKYYKIFVNKSYRTAVLCVEPLAVVLTLLLYSAINSILFGIIMLAFIAGIVIGIGDFYVLGGIGAKNNKIMEFVKSSFDGPRVIKKAVLAESIGRGIIIITLMMMFGVCRQLVLKQWSVSDYLLLAFSALILFCTTQLTFLLTRKVANTINPHMFICYGFITVGLILLFGLDMLLGMIDMIPVYAAAVAVAAGLAVLFTYLLVKSNVKGFKRGYKDTL